tara:strand:+ start:3889 stop:4305 length:417 start_codon:yes stop_codon:yes gene_type:complete
MPTIYTKPLSLNTRQWSDLDLDFTRHPVTNDVVRKLDVESIKRSVKNLILTNKYERLFHPEIGSGLTGLLFELVSPTTASVIEASIRQVLVNYEPRIIVDHISIAGNIDRNGYNATIEFTTINTLTPVTIEFFLERLR